MEEKIIKITVESLDKFTYKGVELSESQPLKMCTTINFDDYSHLIDFIEEFKNNLIKLELNNGK